MSEIKPDVEYVIKTGRQIAEKKQIDFPNRLNSQIDAIKHQFNKLGSQVLWLCKGCFWLDNLKAC